MLVLRVVCDCLKAMGIELERHLMEGFRVLNSIV